VADARESGQTTLTQFSIGEPAPAYWRVVFSNPPVNLASVLGAAPTDIPDSPLTLIGALRRSPTSCKLGATDGVPYITHHHPSGCSRRIRSGRSRLAGNEASHTNNGPTCAHAILTTEELRKQPST